MMRALVIGGTGFIGLHVVDALLHAGWTVRATRRKSSPTLLLRKRPVEMVHASLDDRGSLERAMEGCDVVFLAAAHYPRYSLLGEHAVAHGVSGMRSACEAARSVGVRRVVYSSSVAALGPGKSRATESDVGLPDESEGAYPTVKKAMEQEVDRARDAGLDIVSLLLGGCIGPWDLRLGTNGFLVALLRGVIPYWVNGLIHLVAVEDAARAHVAAAFAPRSRYLVAGHSLTVAQLIDRMVLRYDAPRPGPRLPLDEIRALADAAEAAAAPRRERVALPREFVDIAALGRPISTVRAEKDLSMSWTPLDDALDGTVEWLARHRYVTPNPAWKRSYHDAS